MKAAAARCLHIEYCWGWCAVLETESSDHNTTTWRTWSWSRAGCVYDSATFKSFSVEFDANVNVDGDQPSRSEDNDDTEQKTEDRADCRLNRSQCNNIHKHNIKSLPTIRTTSIMSCKMLQASPHLSSLWSSDQIKFAITTSSVH